MNHDDSYNYYMRMNKYDYDYDYDYEEWMSKSISIYIHPISIPKFQSTEFIHSFIHFILRFPSNLRLIPKDPEFFNPLIWLIKQIEFNL